MTITIENTIKTSLVLVLFCLILAACNGVKVVKQSSYIVKAKESTPAATVYFIRPRMLKTKGFADNPVDIAYNASKLMSIEQGYYTMIKIKPGIGDITTSSLTRFINSKKPKTVSRNRQYNFVAGKTYFVHIKQINEEFRGVFYDPAPLTLSQARRIAEQADAEGVARVARIEKITSIEEGPAASGLPPALPETLYPGKKYLYTKPVGK